MKQVFYLMFVATVLMILAENVSTQENKGDEKINKFEVGGQFTSIRFNDFDTDKIYRRRNGFIPSNTPHLKQTDFGLGGRFTYNVNKKFALEVEGNFFIADKRQKFKTVIINGISFNAVDGFFEPGGRKFQVVAGPKIGVRKKRFGVFAKVRPGIMSIDRFPFIEGIPSPGVVLLPSKRATFLAIDTGGVVEFYPSKKTVLRFDIGNTYIRYNAQEPKNINPSFGKNNLQISTGFGFRF